MSCFLVVVLREFSERPPLVAAALAILLLIASNAAAVFMAARWMHVPDNGMAWRVSGVAPWFAPLAVYVDRGSYYAFPLAGFIGVLIALLFRNTYVPRELESKFSERPREPFCLLTPAAPSILAPLFLATLCLHAGAVTLSVGFVAGSAALAAAAAGIITWHSGTHVNVSPIRQSASAWLSLIMAFMVAMSGLGFGSGDGEGKETNNAGEPGPGGQYRGVFLRPPALHTEKSLTSPSLPTAGGLLLTTIRTPVRIPFDGVYWLYRWPDLMPPRDAAVIYGAPDEKHFSSVDSTALTMEAHQTFASAIDLLCCRTVGVVVRSADSRPETIELELIFERSDVAFNRISLGRAKLSSSIFNDPEARRQKQMLTYSVPDTALGSFNQATFRFLLPPSRITSSPRIAIEALVLTPR